MPGWLIKVISKYKNRDKKAEKWEEITAILGEEGKWLDLSR